MTKQEIRKQLIKRRNEIPSSVREEKSSVISQALYTLLDTHSECALENRDRVTPESLLQRPLIALYEAMGSEVDLNVFVKKADRQNWRLCFPFMVRNLTGQKASMFFYEIESGKLCDARQGVLQKPLCVHRHCDLIQQGFILVDHSSIDIVVVPLVAYTKEGQRLGYGGGNYDRFLPKLSEDALVVGVAFEEQCNNSIPLEPHDIPLSRILSA